MVFTDLGRLLLMGKDFECTPTRTELRFGPMPCDFEGYQAMGSPPGLRLRQSYDALEKRVNYGMKATSEKGRSAGRNDLLGGTSSCESLIKPGDRSNTAPDNSRNASQLVSCLPPKRPGRDAHLPQSIS